MCIEKSRVRCNVILSILSTSKTDSWYLGNRCSRHMTSKKLIFTSIKFNKEKVTFGDGATAKICGQGTINCVGILILRMFYVLQA